MPHPSLSQRHALGIVIVLLVVTALLPASVVRAVSGRPKRVLDWALAPGWHALHGMSSRIRSPPPTSVGGGDREQLERNYGELLVHHRRLEEALRAARTEIEDLSLVRQSLSLAAVKLPSVQVVGWADTGSAETILLNRGNRLGLRIGQAVADRFNLVGRISEVGPFSSTVRLITSPRTRLDVHLVPPEPGAPPRELRRQLELTAGRDRFFTIVETDSPVQVGDLAHLADPHWPRESDGLIVGRVVSVRKHLENPTLEKRVVVEPLVRPAYLTRVVVLVPIEEGR